MKVVIIAKSKRHTRIYHYFKRAFLRLGHHAIFIKYLKLSAYLGKAAATQIVDLLLRLYQPDLLFFHGRDISDELLMRLKKRMAVVMYFDDCLKGASRSIEQIKKQGRQADIMYLTNRGEIAQYRQWGVNAKFITGGCDPDAHRAVQTPDSFYRSEVAFIGKANTTDRVVCMREVARRFDLKLWGAGWENVGLKAAAKDVYAVEYRKICAGAKIILGWNIDPTVDLYFSNRTWYTLGCGGFLLTAYSPSLEELFGRGRELDWFETVEECCEKIEYYLQHDQQRRNIAAAGYRLAHQKYSYDKMVEKIIGDIQII